LVHTLQDLFDNPSIADMRLQRIEQIEHLLDVDQRHPDPTCRPDIATPLRYAVLHHVLEEAETTARANDSTALADIRRSGTSRHAHLATETPIGPSVIIKPPQMAYRRSTFSETPYFVLTSDTAPADTVAQAVVRQAISSATAEGFGHLLSSSASIICLMTERSLAETFNSWTITRLPGTVYTDYSQHHVVVARDVLHEAGHNWLNDAMTAAGVTLPTHQTFYSPWKRTARPAFGFLHACWAFPLTMIYVASAISSADPTAAPFLTAYLDQQRSLLAETAQDHSAALRLVTDMSLACRLETVYHQARRL